MVGGEELVVVMEAVKGVGAFRRRCWRWRGVGVGTVGVPGSPQKRRLFLLEAFSGLGKHGAVSLPLLAPGRGWRWRQSGRWLQLLFYTFSKCLQLVVPMRKNRQGFCFL